MSLLAYLFWELSVSALCLATVIRIQPFALRLALATGLNITLSALCATVLTFLHLNSSPAFLTLAAVFAAVTVALVRSRPEPLLDRAQYRVAPWLALGIPLTLSIRPIEEVDSLYNLHYMMGWLQNRTSPYDFAYHYVPFWELSFLPVLALTHGDLFFWYNSLKPVLLLGLVLFLIAGELGLPEWLTRWTLLALLLFPHVWLGPSGVSTIKNDMIYAAGFAMVALAGMRAAQFRSTASDVAVLALGATFVGVKFSGPVVLVAWTGCLVFVVSSIRKNLRTSTLTLCAIAGVWMITVGHYYVHNFAIYGSPFYPHQINVGPLHLPGTADLSYSSILYNLHDARLWRYFFLPERGLSPAGVLFPAILPAILIGSAVIALGALARRRITNLTVLALFQLVSWAVYFRSTFSASGMPGDLAFVANELNSLRYVEGPLLIGELCLVWALFKIGAPRILILMALAAQAVSRLIILSNRAPGSSWRLTILFGLLLATVVAALTLGSKWRPQRMAILIGLCLAFGSYLVERRRPAWLTAVQPLYLPLYESPPKDLFYLIDNEFSQQPCWHFPMLGHRLQHQADSGSIGDLKARGRLPRYVAWTRVTPGAPSISLPGYTVRVSAPIGVLLERNAAHD